MLHSLKSFYCCGPFRGLKRQPDMECRAASRLAIHRNAAVVLLDDFIDDEQSKPHPPPHILGGKKGVEDARQDVDRNARAAVANFNVYRFRPRIALAEEAGVVPLPGDEARALEIRFKAACKRVSDQVKLHVSPPVGGPGGGFGGGRPGGRPDFKGPRGSGKGPESRGPGSRGPGSRGPGSRGPGAAGPRAARPDHRNDEQPVGA